MNKLKEAIAELRDHLGRDKDSLKLLDDVAFIANKIRKELAEAKEREAAAYARAVEEENMRQETQAVVRSLRMELERERSIRFQLQRDIESLMGDVFAMEKKVEALEPEDIPDLERTERDPGLYHLNQDDVLSLVDDLRPYTAMFIQLRRQMRHAPKPVHAPGHRMVCNELTTIIRSLDNDELLKLGRYVAVRALANWGCVIYAERTIRASKDGRVVQTKSLAPVFHWLNRDIVFDQRIAPIDYSGRSLLVPRGHGTPIRNDDE